MRNNTVALKANSNRRGCGPPGSAWSCRQRLLETLGGVEQIVYLRLGNEYDRMSVIPKPGCQALGRDFDEEYPGADRE
ncbi:MAG: hypothetical protein L0H63_02785 [Nitrococcus sp.]|nr:hypothetical protein [Nitrococcus sp.]